MQRAIHDADRSARRQSPPPRLPGRPEHPGITVPAGLMTRDAGADAPGPRSCSGIELASDACRLHQAPPPFAAELPHNLGPAGKRAVRTAVGLRPLPCPALKNPQGRNLVMDPARGRLPPFPVPDRDAGFTTAFDEIPASEGLEMAETPPTARRCRRRGRDVRLGSAESGLAQSLGQLSDQPVCFRPPYCQLSGRESRQLLRGRHARHARHTWQ